MNDETQRWLSRSVTEWEECFAKVKASWGYWFPDETLMLRCPNDETNIMQPRQMATGTSTDTSVGCTRTNKNEVASVQRRAIAHWKQLVGRDH